MKQHSVNNSKQCYTKKDNVDQLVYLEAYDTTEDVLAREKQIKGYRREKKNQLVEKMNPEWIDLYDRIRR